MEWNRLAIPAHSHIRGANINLARIEKRATKNHIVRHGIIVENIGLNRLDTTGKGELRQDNIMQENKTLRRKGSSRGIEICGRIGEDLSARRQSRLLDECVRLLTEKSSSLSLCAIEYFLRSSATGFENRTPLAPKFPNAPNRKLSEGPVIPE